MFSFTLRNLIAFLAVWGSTGFVMGTGILMGPSRWVVEYARKAPENAYVEGPAIRAMILMLIVVSLVLALLLTQAILLTKKRHIRFGLPLMLFIFLTATLYMWFNPKKFGNVKADDPAASERFTVGSYPDLDKLKDLKDSGYTAVISLLHPAVVPFETSLINTEKANAEEAGIELIHLPMLPWVSNNRDSLGRLGEIAARREGKYYLHCYLGKDRVNVALRTIADSDPTVSTHAARRRARTLSMRRHLERGQVVSPGDSVYVTPYPTDEELFTYILAAHIDNVVCLMDPEEGNSRKLISQIEDVLEEHDVTLVKLPIRRKDYDTSAAAAAAAAVQAMSGEVVVFDFHCPSFRTEAFIQAYSDPRPALPPTLIKECTFPAPLRQISQNVLTGRRPEKLREFESLEDIGIKKFLYIGSTEDDEAMRDSRFAAAAEMDWSAVLPDNAQQLLADGGPWYVYGKADADLLDSLSGTLGPAYREPADHIFVPKAEKVIKGPTRYASVVAGIKAPPETATKNPFRILMNFVLSAAPSPRLLILLTPFCFFYAYLSAAYAGWLRNSGNVRVGYTRKVFHFLIFTMACLIQARAGIQGTVIFGTVVCTFVMYAMLRGNGFAFYESMARPTDAPHRTLYIFIPMVTTAVGGVIANIFFQPVAMIGYLVGGWGDAVGEPVGAKFGKHKYKVFSLAGVPATRSLEGSAAVMTASFLAAFLGLAMIGAPLQVAAAAALVCAMASCLTEALSTHGLDNLTVQIVSCAAVFYMLRAIA